PNLALTLTIHNPRMSDPSSQPEVFGEFPAEPPPAVAVAASPGLEPLDEVQIAASLVRMGIIGTSEQPRVQALDGGVSSEIWLVDVPGRRLCLKRALPQLKVAQLWEAPVARNRHEFAWFRVAGRIAPEAAPRLIGQDAAQGLFVMEYLDPGMYP